MPTTLLTLLSEFSASCVPVPVVFAGAVILLGLRGDGGVGDRLRVPQDDRPLSDRADRHDAVPRVRFFGGFECCACFGLVD